ncbi:ABC transporter ATP-binding protein [Microbacterium sp. CFH 31415]|uniref:ABC transporter ATP-binding protein n=1 Tax=Microbacterium sp. CFH 31415 TaxID=2921732 RepID=UPI001F12EFFC|nr:ABC transporter ATP-binding protein [Microbacterium sp. CFH 31415]MCH6231621.1 ABC transporter ATP-binding protein [Microbacterium sp. CFH 31415]
METRDEALLKVSGLATGYGDLRVVWDVSLEVRPGRLTVLLGRNGAGKTTTIRAITGLNKISGGSVVFDGQDVSKRSVSERVRMGMSFVQEGKRVMRSQTVEENLLLGGRVRRVRRAELREDVERMYDLFPILREKRALPAGSMSGGQQQMLAIASALMARPKLLLLDEPSGGLAPVIVKEVMQRVSDLKDTGIGILLVEQAVDASVAIADDIVVLDMGRSVLSTPASEVSDMSILHDAYFGRHSMTADLQASEREHGVELGVGGE